MGKKIKKNSFNLPKVGSKKEKKRAAEQVADEFIKIQRMEARGEMLTEFSLVLAWVLRANYGFGKKRITRVVSEVFELMSDTKMKDYGQDLLSIKDINPQLKNEVKLDVLALIDKLAIKHFNRVSKDEKRSR